MCAILFDISEEAADEAAAEEGTVFTRPIREAPPGHPEGDEAAEDHGGRGAHRQVEADGEGQTRHTQQLHAEGQARAAEEQ